MACPRVPPESRLQKKGGRSSHVAPRSYAGEERCLAGLAPFHSVWSDNNPRRTACAHYKRAWSAPSRETASAVARPCVPPEIRLPKGEIAARTSNHGLKPAKRGPSLVQRFFAAYIVTTARAARRTRTTSAHRELPPERDGLRSGAPVRATGNTATKKGGRSSHVKPWSYTGEERTLAGATPFRSAWSEYNPRRTARAHYKCAWRAPSQETASTAACPRVPTESRLQ